MTRTELLKISKPILFNTEMVRAILDGRKTVTRRVVKPQLPNNIIKVCEVDPLGYMSIQTSDQYLNGWQNRKAKYLKGDILYVRETFCKFGRRMFHGYRCYQSGHTWTAYKSDKAMYLEDDHVGHLNNTEKFDIGVPIKWRPSIHMPKEAARIFLKVTDVRVERLQDITVEQAIKEGFEGIPCGCSMTGCTDCYDSGWSEPPQVGFMYTWDSTIKKQDLDKYGWNANPWVWVYEFERVECDEVN